jgi:ElaB/YqjD/DUF883 family membrane-anchored ribosome-binding protein
VLTTAKEFKMENTTGSFEGIKKGAKEFAGNAADTLNGKARHTVPELKAYYETAREAAADAVHGSEDFVKRYPFYTVLGAATVGFLAASIIRSARRH